MATLMKEFGHIYTITLLLTVYTAVLKAEPVANCYTVGDLASKVRLMECSAGFLDDNSRSTVRAGHTISEICAPSISFGGPLSIQVDLWKIEVRNLKEENKNFEVFGYNAALDAVLSECDSHLFVFNYQDITGLTQDKSRGGYKVTENFSYSFQPFSVTLAELQMLPPHTIKFRKKTVKQMLHKLHRYAKSKTGLTWGKKSLKKQRCYEGVSADKTLLQNTMVEAFKKMRDTILKSGQAVSVTFSHIPVNAVEDYILRVTTVNMDFKDKPGTIPDNTIKLTENVLLVAGVEVANVQRQCSSKSAPAKARPSRTVTKSKLSITVEMLASRDFRPKGR